MKKYIVRLTQEQHQDLHQLISTGEEAVRKLLHARILLKADEGEQEPPGWTDEQISEALEVSTSGTTSGARRDALDSIGSPVHGILMMRAVGRARLFSVVVCYSASCGLPENG